ncbi:M81 family metallopeptidase [Aminivibrio sp.]|jgi:microcystin degradation protein MlrC|uniref:M81 family metallopeptidase n=1 Tax=Aminivibrio sp. TaxID=1872489 RepID=UPI003D985EDD
MQIGICLFTHETNTFSPLRSNFQMMAAGWDDPEDLIAKHKGKPSFLGGAIKAAEEERNVELIPLPSLYGAAGPLILKSCVDHVLEAICGELRKKNEEIEGVFLSLHGAGCAEGIDDLESHVLREIRKEIGNKPIMVSLDLHGNITQEMVDLSDGLFGIKEYPHVDMSEAGFLAVKCLIGKIRGELDPVTTLVKLPVLLAPSMNSTFLEPMKSLKEYFAEYCKEKKLLDVSFFHGFPYSDHPGTGASVVVIADGYEPKREAEDLASYFWNRRFDFMPESLTPDEAIDLALEKIQNGFVVINETSDNPGGGTPCDGTHLLRALVNRNLPGSIMAYIVDPESVAVCHQAGVNEKVDLSIGGKTDQFHGDPLRVKDAEVLNLSNGKIIFTSPMRKGIPFEYGKSARIKIRNVECILVSNRYQTLDDRSFLMTGADINDYRMIGVKSSNHFRAFFQPRADAVVTADPPGLHTNNFKSLPYQRISRPIFPLDEGVLFQSEQYQKG